MSFLNSTPLESFGASGAPLGPEFLLGAATPVWAYMSGVAVGGLTYWWTARWATPANLEALYGAAALALAPAAETGMVGALEEALEAPLPVGGEAAPVSPVLQVEAAPPQPPTAEPVVVQAAPTPAEPPVPAPRPKKSAAPDETP